MKIALTGKGGVGKTTIAASLSQYYAEKGYDVLAVDADPDANLALALGMDEKAIEEITPISEMKKLIEDRTAAQTGTFGSMFRMNPKVDDIPEKYARIHKGVRILSMGTVDTGGSGCVCPEHVLLKKLMSHLVVYSKDAVIMDMEAGIEHLGRGTAGFVEAFIVVVEPGIRSIQTFRKIKELAEDIGVKKVYVIGNKIRSEEDKEYIIGKIGSENCIGFLKYSQEIIDSDRNEKSPYENEETKKQISVIGDNIEKIIKGISGDSKTQ